MTSFHRRRLRHRDLLAGLPLLCLFGAGIAARGELENWIQNIEGAGRFEAVFFKAVPMPGGPVSARRPAAESRKALDELVAKSPSDADLLLMRARVDEAQLDFAAAEADWTKRAEILGDKAVGQMELADFYQRRLRPVEEVKALDLAARASPSPTDKFLPPTQQRPWHAFERIFSVIDAQALSTATSANEYRAWIVRYPREPEVYAKFFNFLLAHKQFLGADRLIQSYERAFPGDKVYPVKARAWLEYQRGSAQQALALYDQTFQPLWPPELIEAYFSLLKDTRHLRDFLVQARAAVNAHPEDVSAAARVFYYYQQQGNLPEAQRALLDYRLRMEANHTAWTAEQLWTLGQLFEGVHNYNEAARCYYALYSREGTDPALVEKALGGIINLLLSAPDQPITFGSEDFSLLRDIGTLDPYPGFLNGILSLLLNSQAPSPHYAQAESASLGYFHRARAAELLPLFVARFPQSPARPGLEAKLLEVYATYGANDAVIRDARQFLASFPKAPERVHVAMLLADALARKNQVPEELAVYDSLLAELAARAGHVPLDDQAAGVFPGEVPTPSDEVSETPPPSGEEGEETARPAAPVAPVPKSSARLEQPAGARSHGYATVLERYISRLVALKRPLQVLSLFNREIARNPNDPGLYERLATFLDQNRLGQRVESVYRQAIKQFPKRDWYEKLARWYLRYRRTSDYERLSREVTDVFSGSDLQDYFQNVVSSQSIDAQLFLQLNLYAHSRFPHNLAFVRNLLSAYSRPETANTAAWETLIRQHWYYDETLRASFFAYLSSHGRLDSELQTIRQTNPAAGGSRWQELASSNPAAAQFIFEAELWRSHFEEAAPLAGAIAAVYPTDDALASRAASVFRSLAAFDPNDTEIAAGIEENLSRYSPRDHVILTRIGEIYSDREEFDKSRPYWNRIAELEPGNPDGYLEAATIFWDYFLFGDTLRLINAGRKKLAQPALYAYEAGAVRENQRDYPRAIQEYLKGALATEDESPARARLLQLAKRPQPGALVEQATAKLATAPIADWKAVSLRAAVLEELGRRDDLEKFLAALTENTSSLDLLERLDPIAERLGFDAVHSRSLARRAELTTDPVERLHLRLQLVRFQDAKGNIEEARRLIESLYNDNPTVLGVVRATVDFYWRNQWRDPSIDTLLGASKAAYPDLSKQFIFEASRKATEAKEYARARHLLDPLLAGDPYNAEYLAAMADTYAREGSNQPLRDFYLAKIQAFRDAPLSTDERNQRIAALRRGLIPALTRLKDYAGGVAQYIELLNRYSEDEGVANEAAAYATRYGRPKQLLDYYTKATLDSPKDYRWPMVLARLQTYFEDFPAAIASYAKAHQVRPDRSDLLVARATLEERLMRFDEAVRSYSEVYDLTYQNPQWMEKVAELRARQGETDAAVQALRKARIEGRPEKPAIFFSAAAKLEAWNMLPQARELAERAMALAGQELLTDSSNLEGLKTYATVLTRLRHSDEAFARIEEAARAARSEQYTPNLQPPLEAMGQAVKTYFAPEEKIAFGGFLEKQKEGMSEQDVVQTLLPLAQAAGLADLEARWRYEQMMAHPGTPEASAMEARLADLERQRMKFDELGAQLEAYWNVYPQVAGKDSILERAAASYRSQGNPEGELRALGKAFGHQGLSGEALGRYLDLLLARDPEQLAAIAGGSASTSVKDASANSAVASGDARLALGVIARRGRGLPPVWTRAYTGLVGLYYADPAAEINSAYQAGLGTGTVGDRVGKPVDRSEQLAGDVWFYYGSRFGEYLAVTKQGKPEDYLPATLEGTPGSPDAYSALADYYQDVGESDRALADYAHALELAGEKGEVHDRMALILWQQGKRDVAVEHWREAFRGFFEEENSRRAPPHFYQDVRTALENIGERKLWPSVREGADQVLRTYIHRNGTYQAGELLRGAMAAPGDPAAGAAWIMDLAGSAPAPLSFLSETVDARWLPEPQREPLLRRILQLAESAVAQSHGAAQGVAQETMRNWQRRWVSYLLEAHRTAEAQAAFSAIPEEIRKQHSEEITALEIRLAAQAGTLEAALAAYQSEPETAPTLEALHSAAVGLRQGGDESSARRVLEFVYTRGIEQRELTSANFLGLAEIRLQSGDLAQAVTLLGRMALVAGEPFENLGAAAELLMKFGHPAEAREFLASQVKAMPWDAQARLQLAEAERADPGARESAQAALSAMGASPLVPYTTRARAAQSLAGGKKPDATLGSGELDLLAEGGPENAASSEQPGYFYARLQAAERSSDPAVRVRLLLGAVGMEPQLDSPRLSLFHAAIQAGRYPLAYSAIESFLNRSNDLAYRYRSRAEAATGPEGTGIDITRLGPGDFLPQVQLRDEERVALAAQLAGVLEKLHRLGDAAAYWWFAAALAPAGPSGAEYQGRLKQVEAQLSLEERDRLRRPVVTEHLEQGYAVRPRLAMMPADPKRPVAAGGGGR